MRLPLVSIFAVSLLTAACDGENSVQISSTTRETQPRGVLKVVETLQCPETIGVLTRKGSAHDGGTTCLYSGPRGAVVSVQLVRLGVRSPDEVLEQLRDTLSADMPHTSAGLKAATDPTVATGSAAATADVAGSQAEGSGTGATVSDGATAATTGLTVDARGDKAVVRLPGMSVDADGDKASVRFGSFTINADNASETVNIQSQDETVRIQAHDDAAEVHTRAPGDAIRTTYMLTDSRPAEAGWRLVGYEARGPVGGPVVIATVHAKDRNSDAVFDAAKELVTLNVGE
ncbi:MAG: methyltransferase type 11 [Caulobacteraceae bacterium]|nr:methyltransferase type 11 [Caulobacteraceae bacterium]